MNAWRTALLIFWLSVAAGGAAAIAPAARAQGAGHEMSMDQAVKMVERQYRARVVKAEAEHSGGHTIYVLKLLNDSGKVWTVHVDAASGLVQ